MRLFFKNSRGRDTWRADVRVLTLSVLLALLTTLVPSEAIATPDDSPDTLMPVVSDADFTHPGVFVGLDQLQASKKHVRAGDEPWRTVFTELATSEYATRGAPGFTGFVSASDDAVPCSRDDPSGCVSLCGPYNDPDRGCTDELKDARAVYGQALLWWYTEDETYAQRAITILNSYAAHFNGHRGSNGPLMAAWVAELMLRGAEIIRYTYSAEANDVAFDVHGFNSMLRKVFVKHLTSFNFDNHIGNWKFSAADALINLGVYLDDRDLYDTALEMWRERVPSYIYLNSDGPYPIPPAYGSNRDLIELSCRWLNHKAPACQTTPKSDPHATFQNGQAEETCRDLNHTSMGLAGIINTAETAYLQGDDLYDEQQERITTGIAYAVQISLGYEDHGWPIGFCSDTAPHSRDVRLASLPADVAYNAYAVRMNLDLPEIEIPGYDAPVEGHDPLAAYIALRRADNAPVQNNTAWESLTHHLADAAAPVGDEPRPSPAPTRTDDSKDSQPSAPSAPWPLDTLLGAQITAVILAAALVAALAALLMTWRIRRRR